MNPFLAGELQWCPACGARWPRDEQHTLRAMRWLHEPPLPHKITASNIDAAIHDGRHGDRFLIFEIKKPREELAFGQSLLLSALAGQPRTTVALIRGGEGHVAVERITPDGPSGRPIETTPREVHDATARFLDGDAFQPRAAVREPVRRVVAPRNPDAYIQPANSFGHPIGKTRECPSCHRGHAVGTTCASAA